MPSYGAAYKEILDGLIFSDNQIYITIRRWLIAGYLFPGKKYKSSITKTISWGFFLTRFLIFKLKNF